MMGRTLVFSPFGVEVCWLLAKTRKWYVAVGFRPRVRVMPNVSTASGPNRSIVFTHVYNPQRLMSQSALKPIDQ
jgi:hypothetical protein